jgi:tetratricopeptide (TPR) repeat protein
VDYFQQSIREDPGFAQAYAGLAKTYDLLGLYELLPPNESFPKVREAADKALELDGSLSEAYTARALASSVYERDWNAAEQDFQHALRLSSNDALVHHWYAEHLIGIRARTGTRSAIAADQWKPRTRLPGCPQIPGVIRSMPEDD